MTSIGRLMSKIDNVMHLFTSMWMVKLDLIQVCIPVGWIPPACWPYLPACTEQGCLLWGGGVPAPRRGVPAPGGWYPSMHWGSPPPCEQNSWHTLLKILPCPKLAGGNDPAVSSRVKTNTNFKTNYLEIKLSQMEWLMTSLIPLRRCSHPIWWRCNVCSGAIVVIDVRYFNVRHL